MLELKCSVFNSKKSRCLKEQEVRGLWYKFNMREIVGIK